MWVFRVILPDSAGPAPGRARGSRPGLPKRGGRGLLPSRSPGPASADTAGLGGAPAAGARASCGPRGWRGTTESWQPSTATLQPHARPLRALPPASSVPSLEPPHRCRPPGPPPPEPGGALPGRPTSVHEDGGEVTEQHVQLGVLDLPRQVGRPLHVHARLVEAALSVQGGGQVTHQHDGLYARESGAIKKQTKQLYRSNHLEFGQPNICVGFPGS